MPAEIFTLAGPIWELAVRVVYLAIALAVPFASAPFIIFPSAIRRGPFFRNAVSGLKRALFVSQVFGRAALA